MSALLTRELAEKAIAMVTLAIIGLLRQPDTKRSALAVTILDPTDGNVLFETTFGKMKKEEWPYPFDDIARGKAHLAHRTKMNTAQVIGQAPYLLQAGDPKFIGGVFRYGMAVGVSGIQSRRDEMVAGWIIDACAMLCHEAMETITTDDTRNFV